MFCRERAAHVAQIHAPLRARGASLVAIGSGTPLMAQDFVSRFSVPFPVYTDPERASFRLAGLQRRFGLGTRTAGRALRALSAGHVQGRTQGDPWQQGGALVVDTDGTICWRHVDEEAGEVLDLAALLRAVPTPEDGGG